MRFDKKAAVNAVVFTNSLALAALMIAVNVLAIQQGAWVVPAIFGGVLVPYILGGLVGGMRR